jgi:uncharacterized membrane protein
MPKKKKVSLSDIDRKLELVLKQQKQIIHEEKDIEKEEMLTEKEEGKIENLEEKSLNELEKLEKLEGEIKDSVREHPLKRITYHDIARGSVGAFVGIVVHYTFTYGVAVSEDLTVTRASLIFILSFVVGLIFLYATGFRKIKDPNVIIFLPMRMITLYTVALALTIIVLYLYYPTFGHDFWLAYKQVAAVNLSAVVGACTADLIGRD